MSTTVSLGAWRDRTNLFISYRQSYTHHPAKRARFTGPSHGRFTDEPTDSERAGLMSNAEGDGDAVIEMDILPPRWLDIQDEISQVLGDIAGKMRRLDQMHAKHVLPGFDDESVKAKEEREIEGLTQDITRDFTTCQKAIRRIDRLVQEQQHQNRGGVSNADATMAKNLKMSLASRIGDVSTSFRKKQSAYMKKLRQLGGMGTSSPFDRSGTPMAQNPYNDPAMMDSEADRSSAQSTLLQTAQVRKRTGVQDAAIEQREREIEKIAQGIIDLSNLFQEIQTMVIDQGTVLDRIDYNVDRTAEHVKEADKELKVATGYQKRSTKRKIILLLVLIVVGMFILLLVKPRSQSGGQPAPAPPPPVEPPVPNDPGAGLPPRLSQGENVPDAAGLFGNEERHLEWKQRRRRPSSSR
ncbi:t-SNARE affecting a late Golgi compartment protein 2 [Fulvia fulva]|uniref:t-SNARE affecting a late Golgi compartment protein 2 n=1 Tax=Passalora fulva TaxID=5499 RepID=A0A9Q8LIX4_PASFU|nr:t-SNARE affecting a late Golgi compartment protein 2 [Fulvia fulva]KAK4623546.1 t-SNARE affecting a late Golgi compartment protein 2 [Fulvia fulva]KAK4625837.1 t-SNARE affecting a late Golgi compartment protein 2 [Fulvia fulva]UJO18334.1 t-SNARE affecting a late Golgi compartment protein 2 [Fulvia fulva]WPV15113.1 t-SNARE affecting a late Golgi compartment protein 2 [Fulvia fulva]WPV29966.1 t-SNARE affecting a late Golgi compartment protein 2 [Fulvia fulva]